MELKELYVGCRTYRRFLQEPVEESVVREALENARIASCGANAQALYYVAVTSKEMVEAMQPLVKFAAYLPPEIGMPKKGEQPVGFIVIVKKPGAGAFSDVDVGIAANTIATSLWEHGVGSCLMGAINIKKIAELLAIPEEDTIRLAISYGKPAHTSTLVPVGEDGSIKYFVDEDRNYYVPKKAFDEVVRFV